MVKLSFITPENRALVEKLSKKKVTNIKFDGKTCTFTFDGQRLKHRVKELRHLAYVGKWSPNGDWRTSKKTLYYDNDVRLEGTVNELLLVCTHEGIERYLEKRYGLSWVTDAHYVASQVEHALAKRMGVNWNDYTWKIEFINRKETEYARVSQSKRKPRGVGSKAFPMM